MPKIVAATVNPADPGARALRLSSLSNRANTPKSSSSSDRTGGAFDQALSGARRRSAEANKPQASSRSSEKSKTQKPRESKRHDNDAKSVGPRDDAKVQRDRDENDVNTAVDAHDDGDRHAQAEDDTSGKVSASRKRDDKDAGDHDVRDCADAESETGEATNESHATKPGEQQSDDADVTDSPAVDAIGDDGESQADGAAKAPGVAADSDAAALLAAVAAQSQQNSPVTETAAADDSGAADGSTSGAAVEATAPSTAHATRAAGPQQARPTVCPIAKVADGDAADVDAQGEAATDGEFAAQMPGVPADFDVAQSIEAFDPHGDASLAKSSAHSATADVVDAVGARAAGEVAPASPGKLPVTGATDRAQQAPLAPEARFAEDNHPGIVSGIRGQLLPSGGTMHIRLDPPELGPLAVTVRLRNGTMEASFEASSDEAAKLLSHSLSSLKTSLESQGVNVERLHVSQAPKSQDSNQSGGNGDQQQQARDPQQEHAARQEHQRREMLRKMWAKLRGVDDPLDMVA